MVEGEVRRSVVSGENEGFKALPCMTTFNHILCQGNDSDGAIELKASFTLKIR